MSAKKTPPGVETILTLALSEHRDLIMAVRLNAFQHPGAWGVTVGDLVHHLAVSLAKEGSVESYEDAMQTLMANLAHTLDQHRKEAAAPSKEGCDVN